MNVTFNEETMRKLMMEDAYINFLVKDLMSLGHSEPYALEIVFNSSVLDDSLMLEVYIDLGEEECEK